MNIKLAKKVFESCKKLGVQEYCLCAGARNSPFVVLLEQATGVQVYHFFDERSAAFFALGRIQQTGRPVGVITTSGTAVAELLPAAVEATYSGLPLLLITADRPRSYRKTGAPQTIEQVGILSNYVETCLDFAGLNEDFPIDDWTLTMPLQVNVCFDEPLIDEPVMSLSLAPISIKQALRTTYQAAQKRVLNKPVIVVGRLQPEIKETVIQCLLNLNSPVYAEVNSGLRGEPRLFHLLMKAGEKTLSKGFENGWFQSLLRLGGVPTLRFWRDLEDKFKTVPVHSLSNQDYTGLSRRVSHLVGFDNIHVYESQWSQDDRPAIMHADQETWNQTKTLFAKYPRSEPALVHQLIEKLAGVQLYIGNSLPIREVDLATSVDKGFRRVFTHRGANGIDGQVSGFLGSSSSHAENWCVLGDLTTLYDLSALWVTPQLKSAKRRLVVLNNSGGQIFKNIFRKEIFVNAHQLEFSSWAKMFSWDYLKWNTVPEDIKTLPDHVVIELVPDSSQSDQFWKDFGQLR